MRILNIIKFIILCIVSAILIFIAIDTSYTKESNHLEITFLDVGQGDCAYIKTPDNFRVLIDSGDKGSYENYLKRFLGSKRIKRINAGVITHFDSDHCYGLLEMFGKKKIDKVYYPKGAYNNALTEILNNNLEYYKTDFKAAEIGDAIYLGEDGVAIRVIFPSDFIYDNTKRLTDNNNSIIIYLEYKDKKFLFMGDVDKDVEKQLVEFMDLDIDVLKVAHHGSDTSSSKIFLNEISPDYAVISCGYGNKFNFPDRIVIKRLENVGAKILRTDLDGNITFVVDDKGNISIKTEMQGD